MTKRFLSIDVLKGLGIIFLIIVHEWFWVYFDLSVLEVRFKEMVELYPFFGYFGIPSLGFQVPLLAGVSFYLVTHFKKRSWKAVYQRAAILILMGFGVNFLCWGGDGTLYWDALQFIGLSMMISFPFLKWLPSGWNVLMLTGGGFLCLCFADKFPFIEFADHYLYAIIMGSPTGEHFWAMCPWFYTFAVGLLCGFVLVQRNLTYSIVLVLVGVASWGASLLTQTLHPVVTLEVWGKDMFKPSPFFILGLTGVSIILIFSMEFIFKRFVSLKKHIEKSFLVILGKSILWIYLFNLIVGYHVTQWVLKKYSISYSNSFVAYWGLVIGNLFFGYIIAYGIHQNREIKYA